MEAERTSSLRRQELRNRKTVVIARRLYAQRRASRHKSVTGFASELGANAESAVIVRAAQNDEAIEEDSERPAKADEVSAETGQAETMPIPRTSLLMNSEGYHRRNKKNGSTKLRSSSADVFVKDFENDSRNHLVSRQVALTVCPVALAAACRAQLVEVSAGTLVLVQCQAVCRVVQRAVELEGAGAA